MLFLTGPTQIQKQDRDQHFYDLFSANRFKADPALNQ